MSDDANKVEGAPSVPEERVMAPTVGVHVLTQEPVVNNNRTGRTFARLVKQGNSDVVVEIIAEREDIEKEWHPDVLANFVELTDKDNPKPEAGWVFTNNKFSKPPKAEAPLADRKTVMLWRGITITSESNNELNGTYRCDLPHKQVVLSEMVLVKITETFSTGEVTMPWPDADDVPHTFSTSQFTSFGQAVSKFFAAVTAWDGSGCPPNNKVGID